MKLLNRQLHHDISDDELLLQRIREIVSNFSYKEGWEITAKLVGDQIHITTEKGLPNSHRKNSTATVIQTFAIDTAMFHADLERQTLSTIRTSIRLAELHEMDEWCVYKGQRLWNPHDYNANF